MTNNNIRRALYLFSGVVLTAILVLFGKSYYVEAAVKDGQKFDDWVVACSKEGKKQVCYLSQVLVAKDKQEQRIAEFRIGYFGTKDLKMVQILPFGVNVQVGTSIISDKKLIAPGKFTTCQTFGCIAVADLTKESIDQILNSPTNFVAIIPVEGEQMNIAIASKGLKEGLEALASK